MAHAPNSSVAAQAASYGRAAGRLLALSVAVLTACSPLFPAASPTIGRCRIGATESDAEPYPTAFDRRAIRGRVRYDCGRERSVSADPASRRSRCCKIRFATRA